LHERHRCRIERRNGTTSIGSDAKPSPKVWQLQFHVNKTTKDSSPFAMSVSGTFLAKCLQNRGIGFCKDVGYEGCWSIAPKKSKMSVLAEAQHLIVNETVRYNVELIHVDLDCSCLRLHRLLHPFIIANGYPCDTQPRRGDACVHARQTCELRIGLQSILKKSTCMIVVANPITRKEAIELWHYEIEVKILLEYLFELSSKSKTFFKWCNDEDSSDIVADGSPGASSMTCKNSAKRWKSGNSP